MKNFLTLVFLISTFQISTAQNWAPLPSGDPNFIVDSALQRLVCIPIDSVVEQGTVKTYHIKRDFTVNYDTLTFDKSYFLGYSVSFDTATGAVQSQADWPYRLEVYAPKDSRWSFNTTLTATVDSVLATTTFGQEDSLKYISLDTALSQIILSKAFGIMQFPQLDTAGEAYTLKGVQNQAGDYQPGFDFFYDFDVNDSIQFVTAFRLGYLGNDEYDYNESNVYKIRVVNIEQTSDSIFYFFNGLGLRRINEDVEYFEIDSLKLAIKIGGWFTKNQGVFQKYNNEPFLAALEIKNRVFHYGRYFRMYLDFFKTEESTVWTEDLNGTPDNNNYLCSGCAYEKINDTLYTTKFNENLRPSDSFQQYYVKNRLFNAFDMWNEEEDYFVARIGGRSIHGVKSGKFDPDSYFKPTSIKSSAKTPVFSLKQNTQSIQIDSQDEMSSISLIDVQGKRLFQTSPQSPFDATLQLGNTPNGIYLVEVVFENGKQAVKKIVR